MKKHNILVAMCAIMMMLISSVAKAEEIAIDFDGSAMNNHSQSLSGLNRVLPDFANAVPTPVAPVTVADSGIGVKEIIIKISIINRDNVRNEEVVCDNDLKIQTLLNCRKKAGSKELTREDIDRLLLRRFLPETGSSISSFNQTKHDYTNCSGPEMFHCVDFSYDKEDCKLEYVCMPHGMSPDTCSYVNYCHKYTVDTHTCSVVGTCIKKYGVTGIPMYMPALKF
ncbi:MAG: hypothetical protein A2218_03485 [Elusimicrobia bacterium RIFOXYA2_FULL_53_38]|nr:MAG: hypothetical protein A2218_03485 [Elusimicrobia bacterium RIFOXYA2_FULL_53_38]